LFELKRSAAIFIDDALALRKKRVGSSCVADLTVKRGGDASGPGYGRLVLYWCCPS
jgi:hypothetical protein